MREILLLLVVALVAAAIVFGVAAIITGGDPGLQPSEPDDRFRTLPGDRPLSEEDITVVRFDTTIRGYRMEQVDRAMSRIGYDLGYKDELIRALEAEVNALRDGRDDEADVLRDRRLAAAGITPERLPAADPEPVGQTIELGEVPAADDLTDDLAGDLSDDREPEPAREVDSEAEAEPEADVEAAKGEPEEDADEAFAPRR
jgi:DivIVA domain-containing protein